MRTLFWNTHNNIDINPILVSIIKDKRINLVVLAEYQADVIDLLCRLQSIGIIMRKHVTTGCERIIVVSDMEDVKPGKQRPHYSLQTISDKYIICCVHFLSQIFTNNESKRRIVIQQLIKDIEDTESQNNIESTIIVGDLNINPFEYACIAAEYINGMPYLEIASKSERSIEGIAYKTFYNPMWKFLGTKMPPFGTHYYDGDRTDNIYWHIFDQVLIRPCLLNSFEESSLEILTQTTLCSLLNRKGHPDKRKVSDHLPIIFEVKEN